MTNSISSILFHSVVALSQEGGGSVLTSLRSIALSLFRCCRRPPLRFLLIVTGMVGSCSFLVGWLVCCRLRYSSMVKGCGPLFITQLTDFLISTSGLSYPPFLFFSVPLRVSSIIADLYAIQIYLLCSAVKHSSYKKFFFFSAQCN